MMKNINQPLRKIEKLGHQMTDKYKGKVVRICNGMDGDKYKNQWASAGGATDYIDVCIDVDRMKGDSNNRAGSSLKSLVFPYLDEENTFIIAEMDGCIIGYERGSGYLASDRWQSEHFISFAFKFEDGVFRPREYPSRALSYRDVHIEHSVVGNPVPLMCFSDTPAYHDMQIVIMDSETLPLPAIEESGDSVSAMPPPLESHAPPMSQEHHAVRVSHIPFFMVDDPQLSLSDQVEQSPYYSVERRVRLITKEDWFTSNNTSAEQKFSMTTTVGWSETHARDFTTTVGISFESGSNFIAKFSLTVSSEFSYNNHASFTETYEESETTEINAAPKTSIVMWQSESEFVLRRADGTEVSRWVRNDGARYYEELAIENNRSTLKQWNENTKQWNEIAVREAALSEA